MKMHNKSQPHPRTAPTGYGQRGSFYTYRGAQPIEKSKATKAPANTTPWARP